MSLSPDPSSTAITPGNSFHKLFELQLKPLSKQFPAPLLLRSVCFRISLEQLSAFNIKLLPRRCLVLKKIASCSQLCPVTRRQQGVTAPRQSETGQKKKKNYQLQETVPVSLFFPSETSPCCSVAASNHISSRRRQIPSAVPPCRRAQHACPGEQIIIKLSGAHNQHR